jgi:hypothetical protein
MQVPPGLNGGVDIRILDERVDGRLAVLAEHDDAEDPAVGRAHPVDSVHVNGIGGVEHGEQEDMVGPRVGVLPTPACCGSMRIF